MKDEEVDGRKGLLFHRDQPEFFVLAIILNHQAFILHPSSFILHPNKSLRNPGCVM